MIVNNNNSDLPARQTDNTNSFWGLNMKNVFCGSIQANDKPTSNGGVSTSRRGAMAYKEN